MKLLIFLSWRFFSAHALRCNQEAPTVSILVDLDPASADRTVIVESITADKEGRLYLPDRVSGNILRVDPKSPKPVVVGRIEPREIKGKKVNADACGVAFNQQGDLFIASGPFSRSRAHQGSRFESAEAWTRPDFATGDGGRQRHCL